MLERVRKSAHGVTPFGNNCRKRRENLQRAARGEDSVRVVGCGGSLARTILHGKFAVIREFCRDLRANLRPEGKKVQQKRAFHRAAPDVSCAGTANLKWLNREFLSTNSERGAPFGVSVVSVHFSHACSAQAGCDLTSTAAYAEEARSSGQLDDHGDGGGARGVLAVAS